MNGLSFTVVEGVLAAEVTVRVFDRGPEPVWHRDRALVGPWWRYEAALVGEPSVCERGRSPHHAIDRLVGCNGELFARRWPGKEAGER